MLVRWPVLFLSHQLIPGDALQKTLLRGLDRVTRRKSKEDEDGGGALDNRTIDCVAGSDQSNVLEQRGSQSTLAPVSWPVWGFSLENKATILDESWYMMICM